MLPAVASGRFKVDLQETKKGFSKKPILQLTAIVQFNVLISLSDNYVFIHDLTTFRERGGPLMRTRGTYGPGFCAASAILGATVVVMSPPPLRLAGRD